MKENYTRFMILMTNIITYLIPCSGFVCMEWQGNGNIRCLKGQTQNHNLVEQNPQIVVFYINILIYNLKFDILFS